MNDNAAENSAAVVSDSGATSHALPLGAQCSLWIILSVLDHLISACCLPEVCIFLTRLAFPPLRPVDSTFRICPDSRWTSLPLRLPLKAQSLPSGRAARRVPLKPEVRSSPSVLPPSSFRANPQSMADACILHACSLLAPQVSLLPLRALPWSFYSSPRHQRSHSCPVPPTPCTAVSRVAYRDPAQRTNTVPCSPHPGWG